MKKTFKVYRTTLVSNNWEELFQCLDNDMQQVASFIKGARKTYKVRANDLDRILSDIGSKVPDYVTMDTSGLFNVHD